MPPPKLIAALPSPAGEIEPRSLDLELSGPSLALADFQPSEVQGSGFLRLLAHVDQRQRAAHGVTVNLEKRVRKFDGGCDGQLDSRGWIAVSQRQI
jgi:hypothetical protein